MESENFVQENLSEMSEEEFNLYWLNKAKEEFKNDFCLSEILQKAQDMIEKKRYPMLYCYLLEFDSLMKRNAHNLKMDVDYTVPFWLWGVGDKEVNKNGK